MKNRFFLVFICSLVSICVKAQPETIWQLLIDGTIIRWAYVGGDEFNGETLDNNKWFTCPDGWNRERENELQYYLDENIELENGILKLIAKHEPGLYNVVRWDENGNSYIDKKFFEYTSGWIQYKEEFKYGLFEIRFKTPVGKGLWPAFWLFGGNPNEEFDIFEYKGETPNKIHYDMHCSDGCDNGGIFPYHFGGWVTADGNFSDSYNVMMGEWYPGSAYWVLNGVRFVIWLGDLQYQAALIINHAIASEQSPFPPGPDNTTPFPSVYSIDYIRVYAQMECEQSVNLCDYSQDITDPAVISGQSINIGGSNCEANVVDGQYLKLIANEEIILSQGFHAKVGSDFSTKILDCPGPQNTSAFQQFQYGPLELINDSLNLKSVNSNFSQIRNPLDNPAVLVTKIYPNPTSGIIMVDFIGEVNRCTKIEVFDSKGNVVYNDCNIKNTKYSIDISNQPNGIYLLIGTFGSKSVIEKVLLNR